MKTLSVALVIILAFTTNLFSQTTYYVSSSSGNDSNLGTSESSPWQSLVKVNSVTFEAGDKILFKSGDTWNGQLVIKSSGTQLNRIIFSSYGGVEKPIITLRSPIQKNWTQYNDRIWYIETQSQYTPIERMWFNGIEKEQARDAWGGNNWDGTYGICPEHPFYHDAVGGKLYIYALSNPNSFYAQIEYQGGLLEDPILYHTVQLVDADYITIDGLDIQGGGYGAIGLAGSDYVEIKNCNIGKFSSRAGVFANSSQINWHAVDKTSDFGKIYNCEINSHWNYTLKFYTSFTPYGVLLGWGASNWQVFNNFIKDWWYGIYTGTGTTDDQKSFYHKIYNNEITAPNFSYGKGIQITAFPLASTGFYTWCDIYNNYIYDIRAVGICISSSGNKVYFNVIEKIDVSRCPQKGDQSNSGMGMEFIIDQSWGINGTLDSNYVFNNTFYRLNREAMNWSSPFVYNNLFLQNFLTGSTLTVRQYTIKNYKNNLFYKVGSNSQSNFFFATGTNAYFSVAALNATGGTNSGNIYPSGVTSVDQIINSNLSPAAESPLLNAGIDISSLIPTGFLDRNGNTVNRVNPDIGAIQSASNSDLIPPEVLSCILIDANNLKILFSEPLNPVGISNLQNYSISGGITVQSAQLSSTNQSEILLNTSEHIYGQTYVLTVLNVKDLAGNIISSTNNSFTYYCDINPPALPSSKLLIISASASDTALSNFGPEKTIDGLYHTYGGDPNSRWAAMPTPQWLIYDLGSIKKITKVRIAFYDYENGRIYSYNIFYSYDKINWNPVVINAYSSNQEWTENEFNEVTGRYVKVEITGNNQNTWAHVWETEIWGSSSNLFSELNTKVFLQGCYENGTMRTNLSSSGVIPLLQPYNSSPWNYSGNEFVSIIPNNVVDWVLVELRSDTSQQSTVFKQAFFLKNDGHIVNLDGTSNLIVEGLLGEYFLVIKHRNHLSIMSSQKITLTGSTVNYDFTNSPNSVFGGELASLGDGNYAMFAGDGDGNGVINILDYQEVGNKLFQVGYKQGDLDLNGTINILDYGKTNQNLLKISKVPGAIIF